MWEIRSYEPLCMQPKDKAIVMYKSLLNCFLIVNNYAINIIITTSHRKMKNNYLTSFIHLFHISSYVRGVIFSFFFFYQPTFSDRFKMKKKKKKKNPQGNRFEIDV
jgi:hypothetical protein